MAEMKTSHVTIGLVSPGKMGTSVGAALLASKGSDSGANVTVLWASDGRSEATKERASRNGFEDAGTLDQLVERSDIILSICPPHDAEPLAKSIADLNFGGKLYCDGNAVAPSTTKRIAAMFGSDRFLDGCIIGPPAWKSGTTRMYISGNDQLQQSLHDLFPSSSFLDVVMMKGKNIGGASALKMSYSSGTKAGIALLATSKALSVSEGVEDYLAKEWDLSRPEFAYRMTRLPFIAPKAWRFVGEMKQMEVAYAEAGLPTGFYTGAADLYDLMKHLQHNGSELKSEEVMDEILKKRDEKGQSSNSSSDLG